VQDAHVPPGLFVGRDDGRAQLLLHLAHLRAYGRELGVHRREFRPDLRAERGHLAAQGVGSAFELGHALLQHGQTIGNTDARHVRPALPVPCRSAAEPNSSIRARIQPTL
jgi:hypothetical protein